MVRSMPSRVSEAVRPSGSSERSPVLWFDGRRSVTTSDLELAVGPISVVLTAGARERVDRCEAFVYQVAASGRPVYGLTTGFGPLVAYKANDDAGEHGRGLVSFLQASQGDPLPREVVRAMLLARLWSLAAGRSGVGLPVIDALAAALATNLCPVVAELGSVGASGDLSPLAHAVAVLMGDGQAWIDGRRHDAGDALRLAGLAPLALRGRDALGLVNGTSLTSAAAGLAVAGASRAIDVSLRLSALLVEILGAGTDFADVDLLAASGHQPGLVVVRRLRELLDGARSTGQRGLQEAYSVRCVPQLVGAARASLDHVTAVVTADLNGVSDNPVFFPELDKVAHGGNFFGQPVAFAADALNVATVQLANLAERQLDLLMDPHRNGGLPPLLSPQPGAQSGMTGANIVTTAIVGHMRRLAMPASIQSIPTNMHNQDIVPFGSQAALEAFRQVGRLRWVHGALALGLRQALYVGAPGPATETGQALMDRLCASLPPIDPDRPLDEDVRRAADVVYSEAS